MNNKIKLSGIVLAAVFFCSCNEIQEIVSGKPPMLTSLSLTIENENEADAKKSDTEESTLVLINAETGEPVTEFDGEEGIYKVMLPAGKTRQIKINAESPGNSTVSYTPQQIFTPVKGGTSRITVTDKNNFWPPKEYVIMYDQVFFDETGKEDTSGKAVLTSVTLSAGSAGAITNGLFDNNAMSQAVNLPAGTTSVTVAAMPEEGGSVEYGKKVTPLELKGALTPLNIYVSKTGKRPSTYTLLFSVPQAGAVETAIIAVPYRTQYMVGETIDTESGLDVYRQGADGITAKIDKNEFSINPASFSTAGEQTVTVTHSNLTTSYKVWVMNTADAASVWVYIRGGFSGQKISVVYAENRRLLDLTLKTGAGGWNIYAGERPEDIPKGSVVRSVSVSGWEHLLGRKDDGIVYLQLDAGGNLQFRPENNGYLPIGCYAELAMAGSNLSARYKYKQDADIDLLGHEKYPITQAWTPLGNTPNVFAGTYDGDGHSIDNIGINAPETYYVGLFGRMGGIVKNVRVSGSVTGARYTGGIAGEVASGGIISNCSYAGSVISNSFTSVFTGGIAGVVTSAGSISGCHNLSEVNGYVLVGGIAGANYGNISACRNTGNIISYFRGSSLLNFDDYELAAAPGAFPQIGYGYAFYLAGFPVMGPIYKYYLGGIAGYNGGNISACYNISMILYADYLYYETFFVNHFNIGIVAGYNGANGTISNCYYYKYIVNNRANFQGTIYYSDNYKVIDNKGVGKEAENSMDSTSYDNGTIGFSAAYNETNLPESTLTSPPVILDEPLAAAAFPDVSAITGWETSANGASGYWKPGTTVGGRVPLLWWETN
ncbi:MAG: bacterial Ig-like domain-containing protein [Spirochaetaceae bacterium]|nr:bacterial Ig-like domain-containing protein [Spirochaetaceae bacterium]